MIRKVVGEKSNIHGIKALCLRLLPEIDVDCYARRSTDWLKG